MKDEIIRVEDLRFSYNEEREILKGIKLKVFSSEKIAVLGNNGSGKTTFFMNLNGVYLFDSGRIYLGEKEIGRKKEDLNYLRKKIGIVFQNPDNQIIGATVFDELSFGLINLGLDKKEILERIDDIAEKMDLKKYLNTPSHYLSGGEKKRLCIADIVAMKPDIFIFDEPTAELDQFNIRILEDILEGLKKENKTILLSTHDIDFAFKFADRVVVFSDGNIIGDGTPREIFSNEELLKKANLKKPIIFEIYEDLVRKNIIKPQEILPKDIEELKKLI